MNAYDAAWLVALSVMAAGRYDGETIAKILPIIAQHYYGVTGNTALDRNGDRPQVGASNRQMNICN